VPQTIELEVAAIVLMLGREFEMTIAMQWNISCKMRSTMLWLEAIVLVIINKA
jgi:hypothetical protein